MALLIPFNGKSPQVAEDAFLAPNAVLIGDVRVEARASVWFGAVLRGDDPDHPIVIGAGANVQDGAIVHVGNWGPTVVGPGVTVGHGAIFESCEIGEGTLVGMNAVILQEAVVGRECLLAAGTVILEKALIPDRSVVAGVPGRIRKTLEGSAAEWVTRSGTHYQTLSRRYLAEGVDRLSFPRVGNGIGGEPQAEE
ncbi:MAG: gamma carbonic anhydrase family protein [Gemmatimonadales bacterium]|nr:MAG: gamma carbonic anhydrase family protein [Gemmatimonadales bacterium]